MLEPRKIIHIDADCFYAAIEVRDNSQLRGRPVAIGGESDRRGVISTCNYEARKFGIRSAMATAYAKRLCPGLILLPGNMEKYRQASVQMQKIFHQYTDMVEPLSLDEAYLDVSQHSEPAPVIAEQIRQQVEQTLAITVSAGVAPNKFLAKVASDWQKPDGLTVIEAETIADFVAELEVKRIPGVGKVTQQKLAQHGIIVCYDLQRFTRDELQQRFGRFGAQLYDLCRGRDLRPVKASRERKSLSVEQTFSKDLMDLSSCLSQLEMLMPKLLERLHKQQNRSVEKAFVKLKFSDFSSTTVERLGTEPQFDHYQELLETALSRAELPVRLIGIGVRFQAASKLDSIPQMSLF